MEKIRIRLNRANPKSVNFINRTKFDDIAFLRECFNISHKRANKILYAMDKDREFCSTGEVELLLDYEQLARYVAKRQVEGLNKYWKYPHVIEFVEEDVEELQEVIEIRPGIRKNY